MISRVQGHFKLKRKEKDDDFTPSPLTSFQPPLSQFTSSLPVFPPPIVGSSTIYQNQIANQNQVVPLPSLCAQVEEPEAHPDYESVMTSFRSKSLPFSIRSNHHHQLGRTSRLLDYPLAPIPTTYPPIALNRRRETTQNTLRRSNTRSPAISLANLVEEKELSSIPSSPSQRSRQTLNSTQPPRPKARRSSGYSNKKAIAFDVSPPCPATIFAAPEYNLTAARHVTDADPRGYLPGMLITIAHRGGYQHQQLTLISSSSVYEYQLQGQTLMIDMEDSYILL